MAQMAQKHRRQIDEKVGAVYLSRFPSFANLRDCVPGGIYATADALDLVQSGIAPGIVKIKDLCEYWRRSESSVYHKLRQIRKTGLMNVEKLGGKTFRLSHINQ